MDNFDKCEYCKSWEDFEGCTNYFCNRKNKDCFNVNKTKIIEKSKELNISVTDLVTLINL